MPYLTESRAAELFMQAAREQGQERIRRARAVFKPFRTTLYSFKINRDSIASVKFHVAFRRATETVVLQACRIILCRRRRRGRTAALQRAEYDAFVRSIPMTEFELPGARRGRQQAINEPGRYHKLPEIFARLNQEYFRGQLPQPELCWSPAHARRLLGSYQERCDRVIISRLFDSPKVPAYVIDYLVYHELLHKFLGIGRRRDGKRRMHGADFRKLERHFRHYKAATKFLERLPD